MIGIIDYGMGNIGSIVNSMNHLGANCGVITNPKNLDTCERLILPGMGHFKTAIARLESGGFVEALLKIHGKGTTPILGICLGMHLLANYSEEGQCAGLGFIPGNVRRFPGNNYPVPHMGWNEVKQVTEHPIMHGLSNSFYAYFAHSYYFICESNSDVLASTVYDITIDSIVGSGQIFGMQFHPEKSSHAGVLLVKNFLSFSC